jgi:pimeloyl-ACP methyl ester carboxylesterase
MTLTLDLHPHRRHNSAQFSPDHRIDEKSWAMTTLTVPPPLRTRPQQSTGRARLAHVRTADGITLAVSDHGPSAATHTVVFLHGLCLNRESWARHVTDLISRYRGAVRVISYDHRGHGRSQPAPIGTYHPDQLADDLATVMTELEVHGSVTLVGHSLGGIVALAYLGRHSSARPVEPDGLVLVATAAGRLAEHGLGRLLATPGIGYLCRLAEHAPEQALRALTAPVCGALSRWWGCGQAQRTALATLTSAAMMTTPASTAVGFLLALRGFDAHPTLPSIHARTVIVSGSADLLTPPAHSHQLAEQIPGAVHVCVQNAGHMLAQQVPHVVAQAIDQALALKT